MSAARFIDSVLKPETTLRADKNERNSVAILRIYPFNLD